MRALLQPLIEKDLFYFVVGALVSADNNMDVKSIEKNLQLAKSLLAEAETVEITEKQLQYLRHTVQILERDLLKFSIKNNLSQS